MDQVIADLDARRRSWALVALAIFILCFIPVPIV